MTTNTASINGANGAHDPSVPPAAYTIEVQNDTQQRLLADIPNVHTRPLWTQMSVLVPPKPGPKAAPHKWA
jgi:gentisate 1,2-dioxygenase